MHIHDEMLNLFLNKKKKSNYVVKQTINTVTNPSSDPVKPSKLLVQLLGFATRKFKSHRKKMHLFSFYGFGCFCKIMTKKDRL